ncbi:glycosyltransferase family 61 protein [Leptothoe sp. PORK10 BA2]|uniref:glycosyltransferase family 61 protein n=1 Tax=Leptothoe sp. PORK10 BA2 TaxID=3110254 RepID=UPI002B1EC821|nr:glycosyltransferase family 61 protein [Leptothoe sp. PORK10 BA2]MEA5463124.1 glycosyltransferase family 61 protein [Leptothoe sp. PORK10 BA2]
MSDTSCTLIQTNNSPVTLLRVKAGYTNDKGEVYDKNGVFIDFPRELGSKQRANLDPASVDKQFKTKVVGCFVQERRNYSYYHWTYETLPKLIYLSNNRKELGIDKLYFHFGRFGHPYQRQALRRLGFQYRNIVDAKRIRSLSAKEIVVIKLNETRLEPSFQLCQMIKSAFIQKTTIKPYRKIYLTRAHVSTGRKLLNEFELRRLLEAHGFEIIIADKLSVSAQANLFNESKYIVSPHGAALANIAFCEPGTRILELFNLVDRSKNPVYSIYSKVSEACGFDLIPVSPIPMAIEESTKSNHRSNFYTDLDAIKTALVDWGL